MFFVLVIKQMKYYQIFSLLTCCIQDYLPICNFDFDCATNKYLHDKNDTLIKNCLHTEQKVIKPFFNFKEHAFKSLSMHIPVESNVKIWMSLSVKDDFESLQYYLLHHIQMGIQKFIIYDESLNHEVYDYFSGLDSIIVFKSKEKQQNYNQISASKLAAEHNVDWIGFFDVDEYLYIPGKSLTHFLNDFESNVSVVSLPMMTIPFGFSYPDLRKGIRPNNEGCVKSFVNPKGITNEMSNPHIKHLKDGFLQAIETKRFKTSQFCGNWILDREDTLYKPAVLHFHNKKSYADKIRKIYRGTGDIQRPEDYEKLSVVLTDLSKPKKKKNFFKLYENNFNTLISNTIKSMNTNGIFSS